MLSASKKRLQIAFRSQTAEVHHLQTWAEELRQLQVLGDTQAEFQAELKAQQQRLQQLEVKVSEVLLRPDNQGSAVHDELEMLQQRLEQSMLEAAFSREDLLLAAHACCYYNDIYVITKASFAGLELPRLLNEVKYSNIRGEQPF